MKKLIVIMTTLLLLVGCGEAPDTVVKDYYHALDQGELTEAALLISKEVENQAGKNKVRTMLVRQATLIEKKGGIDTLEVEGESKGELGTYQVSIVYKDGAEEKDKIHVVKEDGDWKISPR